jgi:hypothetical protein
MIAAEEGDLPKVRAILPSQQINTKNQVSPTQAGYTALALAVKNRQLQVAEELIAKGGDVNSTNNVRTSQAGQSVLFLACWNDCMDAVQMLLTSGADVNTADQVLPRQRGWTPLIIAAYHNYLEIVKVLIASGADIAHKDSVTSRQFGKQAMDRAKSAAIKEVISAGPAALRLKVPKSDYSPVLSDRDSPKSTPRGTRTRVTRKGPTPKSRSSSAARSSVRNSSPLNSTESLKNPRIPRSSSISRVTSEQQLAPDKRRQFRDEMDRHIKASANTLGMKVAEGCLNSVSSALASEINRAQDIMLNELALQFKKQTQQMVAQLKFSVSALLEQALASKGLDVEGVVLGDIGVEGTLRSKSKPQQTASPTRASRTFEKLAEMPDEVKLSLPKQVPENFDDLRVELYSHIDRHMEDLTLKLHKLIKSQIAAEVNSRVSRTRNYLSSVLKENLEEVSNEVRRGLERSVKGKVDELLMMSRLSVPSAPHNIRGDEMTMSSLDTYQSPGASKLKSIQEKLPKSAANILQRMEAKQEESKVEQSPTKRLTNKANRSSSTGKLRDSVPVTNVGAALQQFLRP